MNLIGINLTFNLTLNSICLYYDETSIAEFQNIAFPSFYISAASHVELQQVIIELESLSGITWWPLYCLMVARLLNKFTEKKCEKLERLLELHQKYFQQVWPVYHSVIIFMYHLFECSMMCPHYNEIWTRDVFNNVCCVYWDRYKLVKIGGKKRMTS